jgi:hypothetical protein
MEVRPFRIPPDVGPTDLSCNVPPPASAAVPEPPIGQIWPTATIAFGLGLTAAWATFLGYELVKLLELVV